MSAIVIDSNPETNELIKTLAEKLGANVFELNEDELEDIALGKIINTEKTGKTIPRDQVFQLFDK